MPSIALVIAAALVLAAGSAAQALSFNFSFTPNTNTNSSAEARQRFVEACARWSDLIRDPVTLDLTLSADLLLSNGTIGGTTPLYVNMFYGDFRGRLAAHCSSTADAMALANVLAMPSFDRLINHTSDNPDGPGSAKPYIDSSTIGVRLSAANARVLGCPSVPAPHPAAPRPATH